MRLRVAFVLTLLLLVAVQATIAPRWSIGQARPDWVLALVVYYALYVAYDEAILAGWSAGLLLDLMTIERFGLHAVSFALVAALVCSVRHQMFIRNPLTHLSLVWICATLLQLLWLAYRLATGLPAGDWTLWLGSPIYNALWAPLIGKALQAFMTGRGSRRRRRTSSYAPRVSAIRV